MPNIECKRKLDEITAVATTPLTIIEGVTPTWLSAVLACQIEAIKSKKIGTGQMSNTYRLSPIYSSSLPSLPASYILKLAPPT
jgi:hypothetical protein